MGGTLGVQFYTIPTAWAAPAQWHTDLSSITATLDCNVYHVVTYATGLKETRITPIYFMQIGGQLYSFRLDRREVHLPKY